MIEDEIEHVFGVLQFLSLILKGAIFFSEEAIEDHARVVKSRHGLSAAAEGESAGAGGLADASVDRKTERAEAGVIAELGRHELVDGRRVFQLAAFEFGGGEENVGGVVAANLASVGVGKSAEDGEMLAEWFEAL